MKNLNQRTKKRNIDSGFIRPRPTDQSCRFRLKIPAWWRWVEDVSQTGWHQYSWGGGESAASAASAATSAAAAIPGQLSLGCTGTPSRRCSPRW